MLNLNRFIKSGHINFLGFKVSWTITKTAKKFRINQFSKPYNLHLGPGPNWIKPTQNWINVDVDSARGDLILDFQNFQDLPLPSNSTQAIYGSHVFEHMSIYVTDKVFSECYRFLTKDGVLRIILPDAEKSILQYVSKNENYTLFTRRRDRALKKYGLDYTIFECLKEDFLSKSGQLNLLGKNALAHQNAWDYESLKKDLIKI